MADWYLNRALTNWRNSVNSAYPNRDKTSDGTIGDAAHQASTSDHNPDADGSVDAWDMDVDLRSGNDAAAIERLKQVFQKHPAARYWIHNRQIAHRSNGWKREYYSGANAHDHHVHWNSEPGYENSNLPWVIEEEDDLTPEELFAADKLKNGYGDSKTNPYITLNTFAYNVARDTEEANTKVAALAGEVAALKAAVTDLAAMQRPEATVVTDEQLERVLRRVIGSVDDATA